jgi:hypothetical protein
MPSKPEVPMAIFLLDKSLKVEIFFEESDREFEDNICLQFVEECPCDEKVFIADEANLYLTTNQAIQLAAALNHAVVASQDSTIDN